MRKTKYSARNVDPPYYLCKYLQSMVDTPDNVSMIIR